MQAAKAETQLFIFFFSQILWNLADFLFSLKYLKLIFMNCEFEGKVQRETSRFSVSHLHWLNYVHEYISCTFGIMKNTFTLDEAILNGVVNQRVRHSVGSFSGLKASMRWF